MRVAALALALMLGACAPQQLQAELPVLLRFHGPERGGPNTLPEASPSGVVDLAGRCVALRTGTGGLSTTIIASADASVGRDSTGPYLQYGGHRLRHGSWVKGGGGYTDRLPVERLQSPVPAACSSGPFLIFYGAEPFAPSSAPPRSPPPPPIG